MSKNLVVETIDSDIATIEYIESQIRAGEKIVRDMFAELTDPIYNISQRKVLNAYIQCGRVRASCRRAGVTYQIHYWWMDNDPVYHEAFERARRMVGDLVEDEAFRRAVFGWLEPVFYQGEKVGDVRKFDGTLLAKILAAFKPGQYHTKVDVTSGGKALGVFISSEAQDAI